MVKLIKSRVLSDKITRLIFTFLLLTHLIGPLRSRNLTLLPNMHRISALLLPLRFLELGRSFLLLPVTLDLLYLFLAALHVFFPGVNLGLLSLEIAGHLFHGVVVEGGG